MNAIQKLKKTKPRVWTVVVFPVFIFATLIVFPFAFVWNLLDNFFCMIYIGIANTTPMTPFIALNLHGAIGFQL